MNPVHPNLRNESSIDADSIDAEQTLRLLSKLPPPDDLAERVHHRLALVRTTAVRRSFWSLWMPARRLQFAAAAALAAAVAGSTWSVYHGGTRAGIGAHGVSPAPAVPQALQGASPGSGSFGSAKAERVPPTLNPIHVQPAVKKKAGHAEAKPSPKRLAVQPSTAQATVHSQSNQ